MESEYRCSPDTWFEWPCSDSGPGLGGLCSGDAGIGGVLGTEGGEDGATGESWASCSQAGVEGAAVVVVGDSPVVVESTWPVCRSAAAAVGTTGAEPPEAGLLLPEMIAG